MKNRFKIHQIVYDALFIALITIFTFVPYLGLITVGPLSFTTIHILVLIGAALFGYKRGMIYGFYFGLMTLIKAITVPGTLDYFCLNPFISILPRFLFGLFSGLVFDFLRKRLNQKTFNMILLPASGLLTLLHTILFLGCFYIFGVKDIFQITHLLGVGELIQNLNVTYGSFMLFIVAFVSPGACCEIGAAAVVVPGLYVVLSRISKSGLVTNNNVVITREKQVNLIGAIVLLVLALIAIIWTII